METKMETTKRMPDLSGFIGTDGYTYLNFLKNLKFTDGWVYLANDVSCFWLADIVASVQHKPKIRANSDFILWSIKVKDNTAVVTAKTDSGKDGVKLYTQKIPYTDFPEGTFEWYQVGDVVLLKGEY